MNWRERILLIVALILLGGVGGRMLVQQLLLEPLAGRQALVDELRGRNERKRTQLAKLQNAQAKLKRWRQESLPPDPDLTPTLYLAWLVELVDRAGFPQPSVTPTGRPTANEGKEKVYHRFAFKVRGSASLEGLVRFLYGFYQAPLLQQIKQVSVQPAAGRRGSGMLDITLDVEGLALIDAPSRATLLPEESPSEKQPETKERASKKRDQNAVAKNPEARAEPSGAGKADTPPRKSPKKDSSSTLAPQNPEPAAARLASGQRSHYDFIVQRNIFAPEAPPSQAPGENVDSARYYRLTFVGAGRDGVPVVWIYSPLEDEYVRLKVGGEFQVAGVKGRVSDINILDRFVTLEVDGAARILRLGHNLRELEAAPESRASQPAAATPPAAGAAEVSQRLP